MGDSPGRRTTRSHGQPLHGWGGNRKEDALRHRHPQSPAQQGWAEETQHCSFPPLEGRRDSGSGGTEGADHPCARPATLPSLQPAVPFPQAGLCGLCDPTSQHLRRHLSPHTPHGLCLSEDLDGGAWVPSLSTCRGCWEASRRPSPIRMRQVLPPREAVHTVTHGVKSGPRGRQATAALFITDGKPACSHSRWGWGSRPPRGPALRFQDSTDHLTRVTGRAALCQRTGRSQRGNRPPGSVLEQRREGSARSRSAGHRTAGPEPGRRHQNDTHMFQTQQQPFRIWAEPQDSPHSQSSPKAPQGCPTAFPTG